MLINKSDRIKRILTYEVEDVLRYHRDQGYINDYLDKNIDIKYRILPRHLFPNGIFVNINRIPSDAYLIHYNYMIGNTKKDKIKDNAHWHLRSHSFIIVTFLDMSITLNIKEYIDISTCAYKTTYPLCMLKYSYMN